MLFPSPYFDAMTSPGKGVLWMPAKMDGRGYPRVNFGGETRYLTAWGDKRLPEYPDLAQDICDAINLQIKLGTFKWEDWFPAEQRKLTMSSVLDQWQKAKAIWGNPAPATIRAQECHISRIITHIGATSIRSLRSGQEDWKWLMEEFGDRLGYAKAIRATCQACLNWALKEGKLQRPVFIPPIRLEDKPTPYVSKEDRERILAKVPHPYWAPCVLSVDQGFRVGETLTLKWRDVHLQEGYFHIRRTLSAGKIRETRKAGDAYKPLIWTDRVRDLLAGLRREMKSEWVFVGKKGQPLGHQKTTYSWKTAARACALPKVRLHDNRHSFAADMVKEGYSLLEIKTQLGHKSSRTTERYIGANVKIKKRIVELPPKMDAESQQ